MHTPTTVCTESKCFMGIRVWGSVPCPSAWQLWGGVHSSSWTYPIPLLHHLTVLTAFCLGITTLPPRVQRLQWSAWKLDNLLSTFHPVIAYVEGLRLGLWPNPAYALLFSSPQRDGGRAAPLQVTLYFTFQFSAICYTCFTSLHGVWWYKSCDNLLSGSLVCRPWW